MISKFLTAFIFSFSAVSLSAEIDFSRDIRPIINTHCIACHGGVKKESGVSFLFREEALATGKSGKKTVIPGDPEGSELLRRITTNDRDDLMPPPEHGAALPQKDIKFFRQWIKEGAKWGQHWSFEKPTRYETPDTKNSKWPKTPIDNFILARLQAEKLAPSPESDPARLLRRLSFDLTGLPPTITELDSYLTAHRADAERAYQAEVARLLASPHFGERWASNWLDLARYADSEGLGVDTNRPMNPYRDWVIRAFNENLPFDQFTKMQVAGDLMKDPSMDDLIATAFHRLTQSNNEGGTDDEEFRIAANLDRMATTWETWQGITFGCVQCHTHPYEPILHGEYYEFMAFFNNTRDLDLDFNYPEISVPKNTADYARAHDLQRGIAEIKENQVARSDALNAATQWSPVSEMTAKSNSTKIKLNKQDGYTELIADGTLSSGTIYNLTFPTELKELTAVRLNQLPRDLETARHTPEWGAVLSSVQLILTTPDGKKNALRFKNIYGDDSNPPFPATDSLNPKSNTGWGPYSKIYHPRHAVLVLEKPLAIPAGSKLTLDLAYRRFINAAFPMVAQRVRLDLSDNPDWISHAAAPETQSLSNKLSELHQNLAKIPRQNLPILAELPNHLQRETRLFERGNWLSKGPDILTADTPASMPPLKPADPKNPTRLDLANWLTSPENPLTARVAVNRFWQQIFATGIVDTLEDFGSSGHLPSHPGLLDDLAVRFQTEMAWKPKTLLREIVTSSTYRQSSKANAAMIARDPANRLLARVPHPRLSAEMIRDQALQVSGLLNPQFFGPPTYPPIAQGGYTPASGGGGTEWKTPPVGDPQRYRRAIYIYLKRSSPYPTLGAFDAPTREVCTKRRISSNTPIAALATLNDPVFVECAETLAKRVDDLPDFSLEEKIARAYRLCTSMKIDTKTQNALVALYQKVEPEGHEAALNAVTSVLLNLDDTLTK